MNKYVFSLTILVGFIFLDGCAKRAESVQASYVSPLTYQNYSCRQLSDEINVISRKVNEVSGKQNSVATKDAVVTTVGAVIFWPALFFLAGGDHEVELSNMKGHYDAIMTAAKKKGCSWAKETTKN